MIPEEVLANAPRVLTQGQREFYFENGYLCIERLIAEEWLERLRRISQEFLDHSRRETESGGVYDLAPGHRPDAPKLRRLRRPDEHHDTYWEFARDTVADIAADLVGPDVVFHHSKLNFKWNDGHDNVQWHQDIQFYPHTNYSPLTIGTYLHDTEVSNGAVAIIPRSHRGPLYDQYDGRGQWTGCLSDADIETLELESAVYLEGPAGSITVHNCPTVHGSPASESDDGRPLLLNAYTAADAIPYTPHPDRSAHAGEIVRGRPARWAHHDPRPCLIPPDWSGGYTSIFAAQAGEEGSGERSAPA